MPACIDAEFCKDSSLPVDGHHACTNCGGELHGICGLFYNEDSIKFQNSCFDCKVILDTKNFDLKLCGYPPLPCPMTTQEVAALLPEVKWVEAASTIHHSPVDLGAEDKVILSNVAKPSRQYPKVAGHHRPPVVPHHGKVTKRTTLASKKEASQ
jgi:hypothetical protein